MSRNQTIETRRKIERAIHDGPVIKQHPPYFEVRSKGTVIEYTSKRGEAWDAYKDASLPREIVQITVVGNRAFRQVVEARSEIQHRTK